MGSDPIALLIYDRSGHFAAQFMKRDRSATAIIDPQSAGNSGKHPQFVLEVCRQWAQSKDSHTRWIVKHGMHKLIDSHPREATSVLVSVENE